MLSLHGNVDNLRRRHCNILSTRLIFFINNFEIMVNVFIYIYLYLFTCIMFRWAETKKIEKMALKIENGLHGFPKIPYAIDIILLRPCAIFVSVIGTRFS